MFSRGKALKFLVTNHATKTQNFPNDIKLPSAMSAFSLYVSLPRMAFMCIQKQRQHTARFHSASQSRVRYFKLANVYKELEKSSMKNKNIQIIMLWLRLE